MDRYEPEQGRVGYVIFIHGVGVTRYDISLIQSNPTNVHVRVWCSRTAMKGADAKYVAQFEQSFASQGPEWQQAIRGILPRQIFLDPKLLRESRAPIQMPKKPFTQRKVEFF